MTIRSRPTNGWHVASWRLQQQTGYSSRGVDVEGDGHARVLGDEEGTSALRAQAELRDSRNLNHQHVRFSRHREHGPWPRLVSPRVEVQECRFDSDFGL